MPLNKIDETMIDPDFAQKLIIFTNVKTFGAVGDGVTDDTVAIQSVIDSLENGGVIFFPEGTYLVSSSLVINQSNVTLKGLDRQLVEIKDHPSMTTPVPILLITGVNKTNRIENVTIEGIKFRNGSATTDNYTSDKDGIRVIFANNITIKHCMITEIQGEAGLTVRYCRNVNILNNYMYRCTYAACELLEECEDIRVLDNEIDTLTSTYTDNTYAIATGYDFEYGIADFPVRNLWIERNVIRNNPRWEGIDSHGGQNIWVRGNYVENCKTGLMVSVVEPEHFVDIKTKNVFIENNIFKRGNGEIDFHGLYVGGSYKSLIENVVIKGNEVIGFGDQSSGALVVQEAINVEISQNTVDEYYYNGITVRGWGNDVRVHDNLIKNKDVSIATETNAIFVNQNGNIGVSIENNRSYPDSDAQSPTCVVNSTDANNVTAKGNTFKGTSTLYEGKVLAGFEPGDYSLDNVGLFYLRKGDIVYDKNEMPLYLITGPETGHAGNQSSLITYVFSGTVGTNVLMIDTFVGGATGDYGLGCNITIPLSGGGTFKAIIKSWTQDSLLLDRNLPENIVSKSVANDVATWEMITTDSDIASLETDITSLETRVTDVEVQANLRPVTYSCEDLHLKANYYNATEVHVPGIFFKWGTDYQSYVSSVTIQPDCLHFIANRQPSIAIDTKVRKRFIIHRDVVPTFGARIYIKCFDVNGNILLEAVPDGTIGSLYVQADVPLVIQSNTSSYETTADSDEPIEITVSAAVKKIHVAFALGVSDLKLRGFSIVSLDGATSVYSEAPEFLEGAKMATMAPTLGTNKKGTFIYNANPSELGTVGSKYIVTGWTCITAGTPGTWVQNRSLTGN